jgi:hypothetical protein
MLEARRVYRRLLGNWDLRVVGETSRVPSLTLAQGLRVKSFIIFHVIWVKLTCYDIS